MVPRGRPPVHAFDLELIKSLTLEGRTVTYIAKRLGIGRTTLTLKMKSEGLLASQLRSHIKPDQLLDECEAILKEFPNCGLTVLRGILRSKSIIATRSSVEECYRVLAPERIQKHLDKSSKIIRRKYHASYAHAVWHVDTHLKLNGYKIVIHGGIDGMSRFVVYLKASSSNTSLKNFEAFKTAIDQYGLPVRVRADKGGENIQIATYMLQQRGENTGAFIVGKSVHNQRIERYWVDVGTQVVSVFKSEFQKLEDEGILHVNNALELAILHHVYLPRINVRLEKFRNGWNHHSIRTANNLTPAMIVADNPLPLDKVLQIQQENRGIGSVDVVVNHGNDLDRLTSNEQLFDCTCIPPEVYDALNEVLRRGGESCADVSGYSPFMAGIRESVLQLFQPYKLDKRRNSTYFYFSFLPCLDAITVVPCKYDIINRKGMLPIRPVLLTEHMAALEIAEKISSIHEVYKDNYRVAYAENHEKGTTLRTLFYKGEDVTYEHFHIVYNGRLYLMPANSFRED